MKIAVLEDSKKIGYILFKAFERENIDVEIFETMEDSKRIHPGEYLAYIVDYNLKDGEGIDFIKQAKKRRDKTPILMLTVRNSIEDKLSAFQAGADDYLTKPFELAELIIRIKNLIYRDTGLKQDVTNINGIKFDFGKMEISYKGKKIDFSKKEYQLIKFLLFNRGNIIEKDKIVDNIWINSEEKAPNIVNVYINRIRGRLKKVGATDFITTVRGFGYVVK